MSDQFLCSLEYSFIRRVFRLIKLKLKGVASVWKYEKAKKVSETELFYPRLRLGVRKSRTIYEVEIH